MKLYCLLGLLVFIGCNSSDKPLSKADSVKLKQAEAGADSLERINQAAQNIPNDSEAEEVARSLIKAETIDPDGVEFIDANSKMQKFRDSTYVFIGYVKIPNQYSVKVTMAYNVAIQWHGGDWQDNKNWGVRNFKITNP